MSSYCTPQDLNVLAMPSGGLPPFQNASVQQIHLDTASDTVDSYLADQVTLPLTGTIPLSIKMKVCQIAAYTLLVARGYNPENPANETMKMQYDEAISWLESIAAGKIKPPLTDSSPDGGVSGGPDVLQIQPDFTSQDQVNGRRFVRSGGVRLGPPTLRGWNRR